MCAGVAVHSAFQLKQKALKAAPMQISDMLTALQSLEAFILLFFISVHL